MTSTGVQDPTGVTASAVVRQSRTNDGSKSVDDQIKRVEQECAARGIKLGSTYIEEDTSGARPLARRQGLRKAVEDVEQGRAQVVVVAYFDRLARSLKVQNEVVDRVEKRNGQVLALDVGAVSNGSAAQWLSGNVLGLMNEYYSRSVGERLAESKAKNVAAGIPPFPRITPAYVRGSDGRLVPHKQNAPIVAEACRMRAGIGQPEGRPASWTKVCRFLRDNGIDVTVTGTMTMLSSRLLRGEIHFGGLSNLAAHDPIIDEATFRKMHESRAPRGRYAKSDRLLARLGVLLCGTCDSRMIVHPTKSAGKSYLYYICGNRLCQRQAFVSATVAEETVRDETIRLTAQTVGEASMSDELDAARIDMEAKRVRLEETIRKLAGAGLEGEDVAGEVLEVLKADRDEATERHEQLRALATPDKVVRTRDDWDERLNVDEKRALIRAVVVRAVVLPGRGPNRITVEGRKFLG